MIKNTDHNNYIECYIIIITIVTFFVVVVHIQQKDSLIWLSSSSSTLTTTKKKNFFSDDRYMMIMFYIWNDDLNNFDASLQNYFDKCYDDVRVIFIEQNKEVSYHHYPIQEWHGFFVSFFLVVLHIIIIIIIFIWLSTTMTEKINEKKRFALKLPPTLFFTMCYAVLFDYM